MSSLKSHYIESKVEYEKHAKDANFISENHASYICAPRINVPSISPLDVLSSISRNVGGRKRSMPSCQQRRSGSNRREHLFVKLLCQAER